MKALHFAKGDTLHFLNSNVLIVPLNNCLDSNNVEVSKLPLCRSLTSCT